MENRRILKSLSVITVVGGTLLVLPFFGFAYSDQTTHPALTQEIVKFFNKSFPEIKINDKKAELVIQGSIDEDSDIRWMRHFYDPIYNRGLTLSTKEQQLAVISAALGDQTGQSGSWPSAKNWALNTSLQEGLGDNLTAGIFKNYFSSHSDYSWDRAIYEYAWGDKDRGLSGLGHILHLLEDMTVPDHTRNDPHPPILDMGSPYESWTTKFNRQNINIDPSDKPVSLFSLNDYFDKIANYSNNNFFSKDTVPSATYSKPVVLKEKVHILSDGVPYLFGYAVDRNGQEYKLIRIEKKLRTRTAEYSLSDIDDLILTNYWSLLSKQAVLHGAGVINLFLAEVEKEKQSKILYEKNRSWLNKQIDKFKSGVFQIANVFYGITVTEKDLKDGPPSTPSNPELKAVIIETLPQTPKPKPELVLQSAETVIISIPAPTPSPVLTPAPNIPKNTNPEVSTIPPKLVAQIASENNNYSSGWSYSYSQSSNNPSPTPTPTPTPPPLPPPDTTPPEVSFTIAECGQSLSSAICLLATTTINLFWLSTSTDLARYKLECALNNSACPNFNFASTTATSTIYNLADNSIYIFKTWAIDNAENQSAQQVKNVEIATKPLIINEIGWMGTSPTKTQDEWLEIFNPTFHPVNLSDMTLISETDGKPNIQLSGTIAPRGFYLIERTDDTTISNITASSTAIFGNGLNNNGEVLALKYGSTTIDRTPAVNLCGGWCGGAGNPQFWSMERYDPLSSGEDQNNWGSWMDILPANGQNINGLPINGTPGRRNSINYLIDKSVSSLNQNKTLKKIDSPYIIPSISFAIPGGTTLNIEPGVVIKFYNGASSLTANGIMKAEGTAADPIIFTSFKDDFYGGDTNQDNASTTPQPGDWGSIKINGNGSILDRTILRYGGVNDFSASHWANLKVENAAFTLKNSLIEESRVYGVWLINSSGTIEANTIRNNKQEFSSVGLTAQDGSLNINNNTFTNNAFGLQLTSAGGANNFTVNNNNFSQNSQYAIRVVGAYPTFSGNTASNNGINGINLQGVVNQDYTIFPDLAYVIENATYFTPAGKTLTILPGTIFKLLGGSVAISGKLLANGTASNKIIFTSINDDDCGIPGGCGDTNATTTLPAAGDWNNLSFFAGSASSTLNHISIRYGGSKSPSFTIPGALRIKDSSIDVKNTNLENNYWIGAWLENSTSTSINGSTFKDHLEPLSENAAGLYLVASSSPFIQNTIFNNNKIGIQADGSSAVNNGGGIIFTNNTTTTTPVGLIP